MRAVVSSAVEDLVSSRRMRPMNPTRAPGPRRWAGRSLELVTVANSLSISTLDVATNLLRFRPDQAAQSLCCTFDQKSSQSGNCGSDSLSRPGLGQSTLGRKGHEDPPLGREKRGVQSSAKTRVCFRGKTIWSDTARLSIPLLIYGSSTEHAVGHPVSPRWHPISKPHAESRREFHSKSLQVSCLSDAAS